MEKMSSKWIIVLVCAVLTLSGCSSAGTDIPPTEMIATAVNALPPDVAVNVQNRVSEILKTPVESLQLESIQEMEWPNGCLGLPEEAEVCTEALTPGWLLVFNVNGQQYRFRIDQTGTVVRQEP
jgi:hypothetical protein